MKNEDKLWRKKWESKKYVCVCVEVSREERERKRIVKEMGKTERKMEKRGRE